MITSAFLWAWLHNIPQAVFIATFLTGLVYAVGWALRRRDVARKNNRRSEQ